jgi:Ca-activated chloride channel family protein
MEQIRTHGENRELRDEVVELGTRYGIVTPYTSYLALEPGAEEAARAQDFSGRGVPGGVVGNTQSRERRNATPMAPPPPPPVVSAPTATTGAGAVQASKAARAQQDAVSLEGLTVTSASVQTVGRKTFYLRKGVWTDSELDSAGSLPETRLEFGSEPYFDLLKREPELARYFALGERVAVVSGGRVYRVDAAKP